MRIIMNDVKEIKVEDFEKATVKQILCSDTHVDKGTKALSVCCDPVTKRVWYELYQTGTTDASGSNLEEFIAIYNKL